MVLVDGLLTVQPTAIACRKDNTRVLRVAECLVGGERGWQDATGDAKAAMMIEVDFRHDGWMVEGMVESTMPVYVDPWHGEATESENTGCSHGWRGLSSFRTVHRERHGSEVAGPDIGHGSGASRRRSHVLGKRRGTATVLIAAFDLRN